MAKGWMDVIIDKILDDEWVGKHGEKLTERELKLVKLLGRKGKTLRNVYLPKLVLRTAKKGENAGNQFYGCSAFPKCRYIQNVEL